MFTCIIGQDVPFDQLEDLKKYPKEKCILILWEPPSVVTHLGNATRNYDPQFHEYFSKVLTWHDQLIDNKKYMKLYYPVLHPMREDIVDFANKKLCTMIVCNKGSAHPDELYSARRDAIIYFESNHLRGF